MMTPRASLFVPLMLASAVGLTVASEAHAVPALRAVGEIRPDVGNGTMCMDANGGPVEAGDTVHLWECHGGTHQLWYLTMDGELRVAKDPSMCLDVDAANPAPGTDVQMWNCTGSIAHQWTLTDANELRSAVAEDRCLDVDAAGSANGTNIQIWECNGAGAQNWTLNELPWSTITTGLDSSYCLDVSGVTDQLDANVHLWQCHGQHHQQFMLTPEGQIRSAIAANRCLRADVDWSEIIIPAVVGAEVSLPPATNVIYGECTEGDPAQLWFREPDGKIHLAADPDLCLEIDGIDAVNGANVQVWPCADADDQRWHASGFLQIELRPIEGLEALVFRSLDEAYAVVDPRTILQLLHRFGYDDQAIAETVAALSPSQSDALNNDYLPLYGGDLDLLVSAATGTSQLMYGVQVSGPGGEAYFKAEPGEIDARLGVDLISAETDYWQGSITGPEAVAFLSLQPDGFAVNTGVNIVGASTQIGDPNGSYTGVSAGVGVGFEGAASWGNGGQYGVTVGIKAVTVSVYISGSDVEYAYANAETAVEDAALPALEATALDVSGWVDAASSDTQGWLDNASADTDQWVSGALEDAGSWFEDVGSSIGSGLGGIFGW